MKNINIVGRGRVATHLFEAFKGMVSARIINPHTLEGIDTEAPLTLISVSDNAIPEVISKLPELKGIVAHTSGTTDISVFDKYPIERKGVFYPLQTFTIGKKLNYQEIPVFIEASDAETESALMEFGKLFSSKVKRATSADRKKLHIASVFACNFVNHLWALSSDYMDLNGLDFNDLIPLIKETTCKIRQMNPHDAQTGPAIRKDTSTIDSHLDELRNNQELMDIYRLLTHSIMKN